MNPRSSNTAGAKLPERSQVRLGFIPLTDCAPLVMALELGFFARQGLDVTLTREPSWSNIRGKVCAGVLDGAHMLAGMPLAISLGVEVPPQAMATAFSMSLNGDAITVSNALYRRLADIDPGALARRPVTARALARLIEHNRARGRALPRFAMADPSSSQHYLLRYWLASAGIDPDRDLQLSVASPSCMAEHLRKGLIDGFCAGEPWNTRAVEAGVGHVLITSREIWNNHPEKVFGVTRAWAERYPHTHRALLMALMQAAIWLDEPQNRAEAVRILSAPQYLHLPEHSLAAALLGRFRYAPDGSQAVEPDFHVFHRYAANFPWLSHAEWLIGQMLRWGQLRAPLDISRAAAQVYRPDLFREAAAALGIPCPPGNRKREGTHDQPWLLATPTETFVMGADSFFDDGGLDHPAAGMPRT